VDVGKKMVALISDMNQPLGNAAGLALEVKEAIETLRDGGPADFREHCLVAAAHMLRLAGKGSLQETRALAERALVDGSAFAKFRQMVAAQGGDVAQVDDPARLPTASIQMDIRASRRGYVAGIDALEVGNAVLDLGGGRLKKGDPVDHAVGVITHCRVGDAVSEDTVIFTLHGNEQSKIAAARERLLTAVALSDKVVPPLPLFYDTLEGSPV
jgi:pyrimidine-nucleoside phosphorylase